MSARRATLLFPLLCSPLWAPAAAQERATPAPPVAAGTERAAAARDTAAERAAGREALLGAYRKEYAFLASEEAALRERQDELTRERATREQATAGEVRALEERLRALRARLEAERKGAAEAEARLAALDDGTDAAEAVISQAAGLPGAQPGDAAPRDPADVAARLSALDGALTRAGEQLRRLSTLRREAGSFFLPDGSEARGELLRVGAVAALGASPGGSGTLAPAGRGALQLWSADGAEAARAATSGPLPAVLPLYLFENAEQAVDRPKASSFADYLRRGGSVAWVIVALGCFAAVLLLLRSVVLVRAAGDPERLLALITPSLRAGRTAEAKAHLREVRSAAGGLLAAVVPHVEAGGERLESAASERMLQEALRLERFEAAIMVSAAVAPLLGLLGTVTGMIGTFDIITVHGTGDPKLLAGGISEALITTELGLEVAIPTVLLGNLLGGWSERIRSGMERAALRVAVIADERAAARERQSGVEDQDLLAVGGDR